jgi:hypothetical protein
MVDGNVAFKVTWLYATKGDFDGPCNAAGRALNTHSGGGNWCRQPECTCNILDRNKDQREIDLHKEIPPCSESAMFTYPCNFNSGNYFKGIRKDEPIPMRHAQVGRHAFLTSRKHGWGEDERIIMAAYEIGAAGLINKGVHPHLRYEVSAKEGTEIRVLNLDQAPRFWKFYQNKYGPPAWGSKLFRYLSDEQAKQMYLAVQSASLLP